MRLITKHIKARNYTLREMIIQYNTDSTIHVNEKRHEYFSTKITKELEHFRSYITRIEAHISDENGAKPGVNDIRCLLEARLEGRKSVVVSKQSDTLEHAVSGAIQKLKSALESVIERIKNH